MLSNLVNTLPLAARRGWRFGLRVISGGSARASTRRWDRPRVSEYIGCCTLPPGRQADFRQLFEI
jgi:hypothetical protein